MAGHLAAGTESKTVSCDAAGARNNRPMPPSDLEIPAVDGLALSARCFAPAGVVRGAVLINPATGVRKGYYQPFGEFLAERGWQVVTFDNRGIGGSRPRKLRGYEARMQDWAERDSEGVLRWMSKQFAGLPLGLVGHSFGGQSLGLLPSATRLRGALLVATQSGYWGHWSGLQRIRVLFLWYVLIPVLTSVLGYLPAKRLGIGEDQPAGVARQWAYWGRHRDYILRDGHPEWRAGYDSLELPILAISLADDPYAPNRAATAILSLYRNAQVEHRHLDPREHDLGTIGHFGFFRPLFRETLWAEAEEWLRSRLEERPPPGL